MPVSLVTRLCVFVRYVAEQRLPAEGLRSIISEVIRKFDVETTTATNSLLHLFSSPLFDEG
jgi:hypothetical protein